MVDNESVGLKPNSAVAQIGAVIFQDDFTIMDRYCINLNIDQQLDLGSTYDDGTLDWWMLQEDENSDLYNSVFDNPMNLDGAYKNWSTWLKDNSPVNDVGFRFWCNHLLFDVPMLNNFMSYYDDNMKHYIKYNNFEDFATVRNMAKRKVSNFKVLENKINVDANGASHNALYDAVWQTKSLELSYKVLDIQL